MGDCVRAVGLVGKGPSRAPQESGTSTHTEIVKSNTLEEGQVVKM